MFQTAQSNFTFNIPLFVGMPTINLDFVSVNANPSLKLKDGPSVNAEHLISVNYNTVILRIEKASKKNGDYYWDKVISPYGTGYMARNAADDSKLYLVPLTFITPSDNNISLNENNKFTEPDSNNIITTEPNTTVNKIKEKYTDAVIIDKNGNEITGDTLIGTGSKIKINGEEKYTIVKLGDVNGDGRIKASDYVLIKNHIMSPETSKLSDIQKKSADVNKDKNIKASDYVLIKNYIMSGTQIKL